MNIYDKIQWIEFRPTDFYFEFQWQNLFKYVLIYIYISDSFIQFNWSSIVLFTFFPLTLLSNFNIVMFIILTFSCSCCSVLFHVFFFFAYYKIDLSQNNFDWFDMLKASKRRKKHLSTIKKYFCLKKKQFLIHKVNYSYSNILLDSWIWCNICKYNLKQKKM